MIQRNATLAPAITRTRKLFLEQLKNLKLPLIFQEDTITIERSLNGWKLRTPISIKLEKVLEAQEIGLSRIHHKILSQLPTRHNSIHL